MAWLTAAAVLAAAGPSVASAHICCACQTAQFTSVQPANPEVNQPVTITYKANYCRCVYGSGCGHTDGNCQLADVQIQIWLEGLGLVHTEAVTLPKWDDNYHDRTYTFTYTPELPGEYILTAGAPCTERRRLVHRGGKRKRLRSGEFRAVLRIACSARHHRAQDRQHHPNPMPGLV